MVAARQRSRWEKSRGRIRVRGNCIHRNTKQDRLRQNQRKKGCKDGERRERT